MSLIVAIDGPAGSGKGTITKKVGEKLGLINIDTGAMFRCVTLNIIQEKVSLDEEEKIKEILRNIEIDLKENEKVFLNGRDVSKTIREEEVTKMVSPVSVIPMVREKMLTLQRQMAEGKNIIMEGRDIGTVVFPNADVKIYLDASPEERARRRVKQNQEKGIDSSYEEVLRNIMDRDQRDLNREIAPLKQAEDAIYVESSNMTVDEVVDKIVGIIQEKCKDGKEGKK